jgi:hypothetical protein
MIVRAGLGALLPVAEQPSQRVRDEGLETLLRERSPVRAEIPVVFGGHFGSPN